MSIRFEKHSLIIKDRNMEVEIPWNDIYSVYLDKYDLINNKLNCLRIELDYGEFFETFENMEICDDLINNLHHYLPINNMDLLSYLRNDSPNSEAMELYKRER